MKSILVVLCIAFAIQTSGQTPTTTTYITDIGNGAPPIPTVHSEIPNTLPAVSIGWHYDAQQKTLTLHLANYSGKDITAYNISMAEKYADGSTNPSYADGIPHNLQDHQRMEDLLGAVVNSQLKVNGMQNGNGTFAAGTSRDQVIPEGKDISDVEALVDMVIYANGTADVQNEQAFRQLLAIRKGQLLAMEKVNEVIKRVLADLVANPSPFKILIDNLEGGDTLDQFLEQYPSVSRELAIAAIEEARLSLVAQLK